MKRMLLVATATLAASAAFAAPAPAQDIEEILETDDGLVCKEALTECARDLAVWGVNFTVNTVNKVGPIIGDLCEDIFPACLMTP